jgi:hypothetical protein
MSKRLESPKSRLICFGSAKAFTNAVKVGIEENDIDLGFGE